MPQNTTLLLNQKQTISSTPKDAAGNPAVLDGPVTFASADATVADVESVFTGVTTLWLTAKKVGSTVITATALQGGVPTTDTVDVTVSPDPIADMGIVLGTPVTQ